MMQALPCCTLALDVVLELKPIHYDSLHHYEGGLYHHVGGVGGLHHYATGGGRGLHRLTARTSITLQGGYITVEGAYITTQGDYITSQGAYITMQGA